MRSINAVVRIFPSGNFFGLNFRIVTKSGRVLVIGLIVALSACASVPTPIIPELVSPESIVGFEVAARIGLKQDNRGFSGSARWRHAANQDELWLYSPLGQMVAQLRQTPDEAWLQTSDQKFFRANDIAVLTREAFGWSMPLSGMRYWILGMAAPTSTAVIVTRDAEDRIVELEQDGWSVAISEYKPAEQGGLPAKLRLRYQDLEIKLILDNWVITRLQP